MSFSGRFFSHVTAYVGGEALLMAAGLVSFPIFTRILSREEYGVMALVAVTLTLVDAAASLGLRHGSQRYYVDYHEEGRERQFFSTMFMGSAGGGIAGGVFMVCGVLFLVATGKVEHSLFLPLALASMLIPIRILANGIGCIFRVQERPRDYILFAVFTRYLGTGCAIFLVLATVLRLSGLYAGLFVGEALALAGVCWWMVSTNPFSVRDFSFASLKEMAVYGYPLIISGFSATILSLGDRYLIGFFLSSADVARYSVPYNLCLYLSEGLVTGFQFAFLPLIMNEWKRGGAEVVRDRVEQVIKLYSWVAILLVALLTALGRDILVFLASAKYGDAGMLLPYIALGVMLNGVFTPCVIGLVLCRQTGKIALYSAMAAALNFLLNTAAIPLYGVTGAAVATLVSYLFLVFFGAARSAVYFPLRFPWKEIIIYSLCGVAAYSGLAMIPRTDAVLFLFLFLGGGCVFYFLMTALCDSGLRRFLVDLIMSGSGSQRPEKT